MRFLYCLILFIFFIHKDLNSEEIIRHIYSISIPEAPGAYNASFIEDEEGYLMAFRYDLYRLPIKDFPKKFYQHIGLIKLDKEFRPVGVPKFCKTLGNRSYDPRIFRVGEEIYLIFAAASPQDVHSMISSNLCLSKVVVRGDTFVVSSPLFLRTENQQKFEKNWVPFEHKGELYLGYTIFPHKIIKPDEKGNCISLFETDAEITWNFGIIRGGTPALLIENEYLAFFHSSCMAHRSRRYTYYMGAYTFEATPPFRITKISPHPFQHVDFYSTPPVPLTKSRVIFPSGLVIKEDTIFISYGENDGGIKVMEIDKSALFRSLHQL